MKTRVYTLTCASRVCSMYTCIRVHTNHLYAQKGKLLRWYLPLCENVLFHLYRMLFLSLRNNTKILYGVERNNICLCKACKTTTVRHKNTAVAFFFVKESSAYVFHLSAWLSWTCIEDTFVTILSTKSLHSTITSSIASYFLIWKTFDCYSILFANSMMLREFFSWIS